MTQVKWRSIWCAWCVRATRGCGWQTTAHIVVISSLGCLITLQELYLLLSPEFVHEMTLKENVSVSLACTNSEVYCFNIHYKGETGEP